MDELTQRKDRKDLLTDIVTKGERVVACLHSHLPRVLVGMVLQYLV